MSRQAGDRPERRREVNCFGLEYTVANASDASGHTLI